MTACHPEGAPATEGPRLEEGSLAGLGMTAAKGAPATEGRRPPAARSGACALEKSSIAALSRPLAEGTTTRVSDKPTKDPGPQTPDV